MKRKLGLGIVLVVRGLEPGGPARYAVTMSRAVAELGPSVLLLSGSEPPAPVRSSAGFEVRIVPEIFRPVTGWYHLRRLAQALSPGFKVVHAAEAAALPVATRIGAAIGASSILTVHSFEEAGTLKGVDPRVQRILAVSEALRAFLVNEINLPRELLVAVPDGVNLDRFRLALPMESGGLNPVVGWMGRLVPEKAPLDFLKAAALVEQKRPGTEFLLAGQGPLKDAVRNLSTDLGLRGRVTFVFEGMEPEAVLPVMDVFVSTSRREGLGLAIIEAMACGKPVVATAQGGQFDVVTEDRTGFLYRPGDIETCAQRVLRILEDPTRARELGMNGREAVEDKFDARKIAASLLHIYEQVTAPS